MPRAKAGDQEVQMDRRRKDRRDAAAEAATKSKAAPKKKVAKAEATESLKSKSTSVEPKPEREFKPARRNKQRRRQIDPTTCERDYNDEEILFMQALDAYKRSSGRMFPTCSEILEVIRDLGYVKLTEDEKQIIASIEEVEAELHDAVDATVDVAVDEEEVEEAAHI